MHREAVAKTEHTIAIKRWHHALFSRPWVACALQHCLLACYIPLVDEMREVKMETPHRLRMEIGYRSAKPRRTVAQVCHARVKSQDTQSTKSQRTAMANVSAALLQHHHYLRPAVV
jgi:hypothetical protein